MIMMINQLMSYYLDGVDDISRSCLVGLVGEAALLCGQSHGSAQQTWQLHYTRLYPMYTRRTRHSGNLQYRYILVD